MTVLSRKSANKEAIGGKKLQGENLDSADSGTERQDAERKKQQIIVPEHEGR